MTALAKKKDLTERELTLGELLEGLPADHGARKELSRLRRAVHILEIIRDADADCKKDGLPRRLPERIRHMIDVVIDAAQPPGAEEIVLQLATDCERYRPDYQAMGDCRHCGHTPEAHAPHAQAMRPVVPAAQLCPDCNGHGTTTTSRGFYQTSCRTCWGTGRQVVA